VRSWDAKSALKARRDCAKRMVGASGARSRGATRALKARRVGASHMVGASGARCRGATRALKARRVGASHMVEASDVRSRGATRALLARRVGATNMVIGGASGVRSWDVRRVLEARQVGAMHIGQVLRKVVPGLEALSSRPRKRFSTKAKSKWPAPILKGTSKLLSSSRRQQHTQLCGAPRKKCERHCEAVHQLALQPQALRARH
jgi:hypothetical protein